MSFEGAITFFIAVFIFGITPGPGIFAILARSMTQGVKASFSLIIGLIMSDICYLIMACFGLAALATSWEEAFFVVRVVGACYLLYLGWKMWTSVSSDPLKNDEEIGSTASSTKQEKLLDMSGFVQGFIISGSNPKVIIFYIAFLPTFMDMTSLSSNDILLAAVLTFFALFLGLMLIAIAFSQARKYLRSDRSVKVVNRTAGSIMASAGVYLGFKGVV